MQIILLEKVANLGNLGDVVKVKDGYARNFLIPTGQARRATEKAVAEFEARRAELEKASAEKLAAAQALGEKLNGKTVSVTKARSRQETGRPVARTATAGATVAVSLDGSTTSVVAATATAGAAGTSLSETPSGAAACRLGASTSGRRAAGVAAGTSVESSAISPDCDDRDGIVEAAPTTTASTAGNKDPVRKRRPADPNVGRSTAPVAAITSAVVPACVGDSLSTDPDLDVRVGGHGYGGLGPASFAGLGTRPRPETSPLRAVEFECRGSDSVRDSPGLRATGVIEGNRGGT